MSAPARIIPAIAHALEKGDLKAVTFLMGMLSDEDEACAQRIRDAFGERLVVDPEAAQPSRQAVVYAINQGWLSKCGDWRGAAADAVLDLFGGAA